MRSTSLEVIPRLGWFNAISFFSSFQIEGDDIRFVLLVEKYPFRQWTANSECKNIPSFETGWSFFAEGGEVGGV